MNKNMVETMQNDMHLFPYRDESISNYLGRLVYSALSYWIRTCIMDRTSESNDTKSKASHIPLGKIYIGKHEDVCRCGGKIYELLNDRTCGALFLRGYIDEMEPQARFVWNKRLIWCSFSCTVKNFIITNVIHLGPFGFFIQTQYILIYTYY